MAKGDGDARDTPPEPSGVVGARPPQASGRRRAAGIYGTIVTAAVLAAGGNQLTTGVLEITVLVTLVVYWLSEQYAELLGEHTRDGHLPSRARTRQSLADAWPMVTASFIPLVCLAGSRLLGASASLAATIALLVTLVLLVLHGHSAGRAAGLSGGRLVIVTCAAGVLGGAMVFLKTALTHHH